MLRRALTFAVTYAVSWTVVAAELSIGGSPGAIFREGQTVVFDSARAERGLEVYRSAFAKPVVAAGDGDFALSAAFRTARLGHWNSFRLTATPLFGDGWRVVLSREERNITNALIVARQIVNGETMNECAMPCRARDMTLCMARQGGDIVCAWRGKEGAVQEVARFQCRYSGAATFAANFDSPPRTVSKIELSDVSLKAANTLTDAFVPSYGELEECPVTLLGGSTSGKPVCIAPGDCLIFAVRAPASARGWTLAWKSEGRIRIRAIQLGSAETLQLSDNIQWDDIEDVVPDGYASRRKNITSWVMRFNTDIKWPISFPATSGVFFFEVSPAGDVPIRFGEPQFLCCKMRAPQPLMPGEGVTEYPVSGKVGAVEIVHSMDRHGARDPDTVAGWLYVYADGTTAPAFATIRWNCGVSAKDAIEKPITPDTTWFGPPGFAWGQALYRSANEHGTQWTASYRWQFVNPYPEKEVRCMQMFRLPGDTRRYKVDSVTPIAAENFTLSLVEPAQAVLETDKETNVNVYEYRAISDGAHSEQVRIGTDKGGPVGAAVLRRSGGFGAASGRVRLGADMCPGGVTLMCGTARSSRLSLMPPKRDGEKPLHYTMICGGTDHIMDFDRMRRVGYDEAKIQIAWKVAPDGSWDLGRWGWHVDKIARAGMDVSIRNTFTWPPEFAGKAEPLKGWRDGGECPVRLLWQNDTSDPFVREKIIDYYGEIGRFAARHPNVKGINANYGQRTAVAICGENPTLIWNEHRLARFRAWLKAHGKSADGVTQDAILGDRTLLADYARFNEELLDSLIDGMCASVRKGTKTAHLAFNLSFHPIEGKLQGQTFGAYLKCGMKHAPASMFHETSERYSLSFVKWLAAARTCGLIYGDECCQNPPSYEQAAFAYMWMGMMQCYESNYCQWWGGRPATENVAQFKAYHRILQNAEYVSDPVCLALSLDTGFAEAGDTVRLPLHTQTAEHYALAHFLRELNINPDRYMIDELPEKDVNVQARLLIDDNTRAMPPSFGERIERFVRAGGVFLASTLTDTLNGHAFLKRFGIDMSDLLMKVDRSDPFPTCEVDVGAGKVAVLLKTWNFGWDPGRPEPERQKAAALLTRLGAFKPLVSSSHPCVFATPYRDHDGAGLVSVINITCEDRVVEVGFSKKFAGTGTPSVRDMDSGRILDIAERNGSWTVAVPVGKINTTVLRIEGAKK